LRPSISTPSGMIICARRSLPGSTPITDNMDLSHTLTHSLTLPLFSLPPSLTLPLFSPSPSLSVCLPARQAAYRLSIYPSVCTSAYTSCSSMRHSSTANIEIYHGSKGRRARSRGIGRDGAGTSPIFSADSLPAPTTPPPPHTHTYAPSLSRMGEQSLRQRTKRLQAGGAKQGVDQVQQEWPQVGEDEPRRSCYQCK
jgi:hypothetical protein